MKANTAVSSLVSIKLRCCTLTREGTAPTLLVTDIKGKKRTRKAGHERKTKRTKKPQLLAPSV